MGTSWMTGMFTPDDNYIIHPTGYNEGGHCWLMNGIQVDYYEGQCAWGPDWGLNGKFLIPKEELTNLFAFGGEALTAVELEYSAKKLTFADWINQFIKSYCKKGESK